MTISQSLLDWLSTRNITEPIKDFEGAIESKIDEYTESITHDNKHEQIDACAEIIILANNQLTLLGYIPDLVLTETIKEISSRQGTINEETGKWEKNELIHYKADYTNCKAKS